MLEIVGLPKSKQLTWTDLSALPVVEGQTGIKSSTGLITLPAAYQGISLVDLADLVGGLDPSLGLNIVAKDGYAMTLSYDQVMQGNFIVYDPATGDEKKDPVDLTVILAYAREGEPIPGEYEPRVFCPGRSGARRDCARGRCFALAGFPVDLAAARLARDSGWSDNDVGARDQRVWRGSDYRIPSEDRSGFDLRAFSGFRPASLCRWQPCLSWSCWRSSACCDGWSCRMKPTSASSCTRAYWAGQISPALEVEQMGGLVLNLDSDLKSAALLR